MEQHEVVCSLPPCDDCSDIVPWQVDPMWDVAPVTPELLEQEESQLSEPTQAPPELVELRASIARQI